MAIIDTVTSYQCRQILPISQMRLNSTCVFLQCLLDHFIQFYISWKKGQSWTVSCNQIWFQCFMLGHNLLKLVCHLLIWHAQIYKFWFCKICCVACSWTNMKKLSFFFVLLILGWNSFVLKLQGSCEGTAQRSWFGCF